MLVWEVGVGTDGEKAVWALGSTDGPFGPTGMNSKGNQSAGQCASPATVSYTVARSGYAGRFARGWGVPGGRGLSACAMCDASDVNPVELKQGEREAASWRGDRRLWVPLELKNCCWRLDTRENKPEETGGGQRERARR